MAELTTDAESEPIRVLVVDDQELFRRGLTMLLAVVVFKVLETPFNRLKRHYEYGKPMKGKLAAASNMPG